MAGIVHISEEEAARDFAAVMQHIRSGDEVRLNCKDGMEAVVRMTRSNEPVKAADIDEVIERLKRRKEEQSLAVLDAEFEAAVQEARQPYNTPLNQPTFQRRTIADAIEIARRIEETDGLAAPDPDMASDMEEIHALYNQPMDMSRWD
jgi:hypothetical protein